MRHVSFAFNQLADLQGLLAAGDIRTDAARAASVLVQVYSANVQGRWVASVSECILAALPQAVVVGATTVGELAQGHSLTGQTVVGVTFFETTALGVFAMPCATGQEADVGAEIGRSVERLCPAPAGVLLLATPLSISAADLLRGLEKIRGRYPVFGGGAGDYASMTQSLVFAGGRQFSQGVVAVAFIGSDLQIESRTYLGWRALSKEMTVTDVDGMLVKTVDGQPAFDVYRRYLDIPNDDQFFLNALEFPFLFQRNGRVLARVPVAVTGDGGVQFVADVAPGEMFRVGYGDPELIVGDATHIHRVMRDFSPDAIFLYTCGCRRFLMQDEVNKETLPFEAVAPTFGFYTYGEFFGGDKPIELLNSTMVAVGMREGPGRNRQPDVVNAATPVLTPTDPYANKHSRIISRLVHFIDAVTTELEDANREITKQSLTDRLTQLGNRASLDAFLAECMALAVRYKQVFSVILLDVDHFKQVNDTFGHLVGDDVLVSLAKVLSRNTREPDMAGRWGGEEFLLVLPNTDLKQATAVAEKLRQVVAAQDIPVVGHKTASFGVASHIPGESLATLLARADRALYEAKQQGRNCVQVANQTSPTSEPAKRV